MSKPHKKELFLHQRDDWYKVYVKEHTEGHPDNEVFRFIPECEVEELLIEALREGMKFGRELESSKNKEQLTPLAIDVAIKMKVKTLLNQNKDEST